MEGMKLQISFHYFPPFLVVLRKIFQISFTSFWTNGKHSLEPCYEITRYRVTQPPEPPVTNHPLTKLLLFMAWSHFGKYLYICPTKGLEKNVDKNLCSRFHRRRTKDPSLDAYDDLWKKDGIYSWIVEYRMWFYKEAAPLICNIDATIRWWTRALCPLSTWQGFRWAHHSVAIFSLTRACISVCRALEIARETTVLIIQHLFSVC